MSKCWKGTASLRQRVSLYFVVDLYIDTMGYAFTLPLFKFVGGCNVACYVHYPTITSDMLRRVSGHVIAHNNRPYVARSPFLTAGKLLYYRLFAWVMTCH
jgi:alpha-1,2-mannosyltransferase